MSATWQTKSLGEVCEFERGLTYSKNDEVESSDNVVLRAVNIDLASNMLDFSELRYIHDSIVVRESKKVRRDSLLICTASGSKSHLGKVAHIADDYGYAFGGFMGMITPKNGLLPRYLFHLMTSESYKDFIRALSDGTNINNLRFDDLRSFQVPYPTPAEQRRIVDILDEASESIAAARASAESNIQSARALFESHLHDIFTQRSADWAVSPLAALCAPGRVITYGVVKLGKDISNGVPCLRTSNVRRLRIASAGMKRIAPSLSAAFARTILRGGEVLVNVRGTLGGVAVVTPEMAGWNISREVAIVPCDSSRVIPAFLAYWIAAGVSQQWLGGVKKGAAYVGINIEDLRMLPVQTPRLEEQMAVVRHLNKVQSETERLESIYQRKLAALDELKSSLLHQAFTGAL